MNHHVLSPNKLAPRLSSDDSRCFKIMDNNLAVLPNELALSLASRCQRWTFTSYRGEYEVNEVPRNPNVERQYETRLDRAIGDIQTQVHAQRRSLEEVREPRTSLS
jgi:uncharacterized membrane protein